MDLIVYSSLISRSIMFGELKEKLEMIENKKVLYSLSINTNCAGELKEKLEMIENKRKVLYSLLINTHCAGCGKFNYVCFWGYCGEYCDKRCSRGSLYDDEDSCRLLQIYDKYNDLDNVNLTSNARKWRAKRQPDKEQK